MEESFFILCQQVNFSNESRSLLFSIYKSNPDSVEELNMLIHKISDEKILLFGRHSTAPSYEWCLFLNN